MISDAGLLTEPERALPPTDAAVAPPSWVAEFREGALSSSVASLVAAVVVAALALAAVVVVGTPQRLQRVHPYLAAHGGDDRPFVTVEVLRILEEGSGVRRVVVLGASSMREAVAREEAGDRLRQALGDPGLEVVHLTTGGQTPWEMLTLTEALLPVLEGVAVLGVNASFFGEDPDELPELLTTRRFGFAYPALSEEAQRLGIEVRDGTGNYLWDQRSYFLSRLVQARATLLRGPVAHEPHRPEGPLHPPDEWHRYDGRTQAYSRLYERHFDRNALILGRIIERLRESGVQVVLVETPRSPRIEELPGFREWVREHDRRMTPLVAQWRVPYLRMDEPAALGAADFEDPVHISSPDARVRYTRALVDGIQTALLSTCAFGERVAFAGTGEAGARGTMPLCAEQRELP